MLKKIKCPYKKLKKAINHGLVLRKVQRFINFNQKNCLKTYIDMNTELVKQIQEMILKINFFKLMSNPAFGKTMENVENVGAKL